MLELPNHQSTVAATAADAMLHEHIDDLEANAESLSQICRLCLKLDDLMISIYDRLDPNPNKRPLHERIADMFQIKISPTDGLPTNICHRCLYHTEQFSDFRESIRQCETRLQKFVVTNPYFPILPTKFDQEESISDVHCPASDDEYYPQQQPASDHPDVQYQHHDVPKNPSDQQLEIAEDTEKIVLVVDPTKEYASSSEEEDDCDNDADLSDGERDYDNTNSNQHQEDLDGVMMKPVSDNGLHIPRLHLPVAETAEGFKNLFFCQFCDTAYVDQEDCFDHESSHDALNPHQCNFCSFSCASRNTAVAHIKECHEPEKPFICVICEKRFGRRSDLRKHSIVHTGIRPFGCPVCGKNFSRNTNLTKHLRIHSGLKPHVCQQCPRSFTTRADLLRHAQVHSEVKPFQCSQCPATYSRRYKFLHHEKTHHGIQSYEEDTDQMGLGEADTSGEMMNGSSGDLDGNGASNDVDDDDMADRYDSENMVISLDPFADLNSNAEEDRFLTPPPISNANLASIQPRLGNPMKLEPTPTSAAAPNISTFVFQDHIQEITFPSHVTGDAVTFLSHPPPAKPKKFACDHCPKRFATQSSLHNHKNIHLGVRNHVCSVCQKCFVRKRELDRHSVIHTGHKPFACVHCPKRFGRKDKLVRHERIHMEEKMFACTTCPMTFNRRDGLLLHMRTHLKHEEAAMLLMAQHHQQQHHQQQQQQQHQQAQMMHHPAARLPPLLPPALTLSNIPPPAPTLMVGVPPHRQGNAQMFATGHPFADQKYEPDDGPAPGQQRYHHHSSDAHMQSSGLLDEHRQMLMRTLQDHGSSTADLELKQEFFS